MRESPALAIIELLEARGAVVAYHDPFVAGDPADARARRRWPAAARCRWTPERWPSTTPC